MKWSIPQVKKFNDEMLNCVRTTTAAKPTFYKKEWSRNYVRAAPFG